MAIVVKTMCGHLIKNHRKYQNNMIANSTDIDYLKKKSEIHKQTFVSSSCDVILICGKKIKQLDELNRRYSIVTLY